MISQSKIEMHPDWRKRWIDALRSGKYKQTTRALRRFDTIDINGQDPRYCCLGVLCEISGQGSWVGAFYRTEGKLNVSSSTTSLPSALANLTELGARAQDLLIEMNDVQALTFLQIADALDQLRGSRP